MITGLTDKSNFRRDGKIRAGTRDDSTGKMNNLPHFLLHDAPQLIPVLTEHPTEIYFTVHTDDVEEFFRPSLRWYTKSELKCVSTHEPGKQIAAYMDFGDAPGVKQTPHPRWPKARERTCLYKTCPQYLEGKCGEHFFLDIIVPQYSMGSVFTLDNTSIMALLNVDGAIKKGFLASGGRLAGQVFKLSKKVIPVAFTDVEKGKKFNRDQAVIHLEFVPPEKADMLLKDKVTPDNWAALIGLRTGSVRLGKKLPSPDLLPVHEAQAALTDQSEDVAVKQEDDLKVRANDPTVVKLIDELAVLVNKPNTEEMRIQLARVVNPPTVIGLVDYVKGRIAKEKKRAKEEVEVKPVAIPLATTPAAGASPSLF